MLQRTAELRESSSPLVKVRRIGFSRYGDPIDLISIGRGMRNALLVGTPHPNEPIGCLTIEFLIEHLQQDPSLAGELDFTWHFIKTIEPDGLRLNEGWLKRVHDPATYLHHYFRPAFDEQAEYTFPLSLPHHEFDKSTPENLAWQEAIQLVRPDLMVSLHNAEHGGGFYILSRDVGTLAAQLAAQLAQHSVPVDLVGDMGAELRQLAPGVFQTSSVAQTLAASGGRIPWSAGDMSFGHTESLGTLGLIIEVPYWIEVDTRSAAHEPDVALSDALKPALAWSDDVGSLLERHRQVFQGPCVGKEERFARAIDECRKVVTAYHKLFGLLPATPLSASVAAAQQRVMRLQLLRPVAMLARLATLIEQRVDHGEFRDAAVLAQVEASTYLSIALNEPLLAQGLKPLPLRSSVQLQVDAVLTAARALQDNKI